MSQIIVGLDIGTSKVCALVASLEDNGDVNILGLASSPSDGLIRGNIVNIERTAESIRDVINAVENQSGEKIREVIVGVIAGDVQGVTSKSVITTRSPDHEITPEDINRLIEDARNIRYPSDRFILHTLPQEFIVDGVDSIKNPVGMTGVRIEAIVHLVMASKASIDNFRKTVKRAGLEVEEFVFQPLASARAVLDPEEMEIGAALVDIGAGTTDIAVFENGIIKYSGSLPIAGNEITNDIRKAFRIQRELAEKLKVTEGYAYIDAITQDKNIVVQGIGGRGPFQITRSMLCQVIQSKVEEIFEALYIHHLRQYGLLRNLNAGIVLTGGTSLLKGIVELATYKFQLPVRVGIPAGFSGGFVKEVQNPIYATAAGLVLYRIDEIKSGQRDTGGGFKEVVKKLNDFIKEIFR